MAEIVRTYTNEAGHEIAVYASGVEYDKTIGRLVKAAPENQITSENSDVYRRKRQEYKRARLLAGAARTLERTDGWTLPNDMDVVEALGEAVMMKALNPDNAKQVDAARFILDEAGLRDKALDPDGGTAVAVAGAQAQTAEAIARIMADVLRLHERQSAEVVEGKVKDE